MADSDYGIFFDSDGMPDVSASSAYLLEKHGINPHAPLGLLTNRFSASAGTGFRYGDSDQKEYEPYSDSGIYQYSSDDPWKSLQKIWDKQQEAADIAWERSESSAKAAQDHEAAEAKKARDWQIAARRNYYQDMMYSLEQAGLNPALALYNTAGFSTPTASDGAKGHQATASKASVSTENISMELLTVIIQALAGLGSSALKLMK